MIMKAIFRVGLLGALLASAPPGLFAEAAADCPVTEPNGSPPRRYGNGKLWTTLWPEGTVIFRPGGPGFVLDDGSVEMKFPWWREVQGKLTIQGRRLDTPAPPLRADIPDGYGERGFQASGIIFPTEGCWQVTGKVGDTSLTFVTRVIKVRETE